MSEIINKKEDLHPIGSYWICWYPPDIGSTSITAKTEVLYQVEDHRLVFVFGSYGPSKWVETLKTIESIEHPCPFQFDGKYELPPSRFIADEEALDFIERAKNYPAESPGENERLIP